METRRFPAARRFPPPWSADETDACFIVRDHNGQALAYVFEPGFDICLRPDAITSAVGV